jgi:hypothetical protein
MICIPTQAYVAIGAWDRVKFAFQLTFELGIRDKEESEALVPQRNGMRRRTSFLPTRRFWFSQRSSCVPPLP